MLDAVVAMTDIVTNFWSMGVRGGELRCRLIMHGFRATDGWFILQVGREPQFARLAQAVGHPEWLDDPRLATRQGWVDHLEDCCARDRGLGRRSLQARGVPAAERRRPGRRTMPQPTLTWSTTRT